MLAAGGAHRRPAPARARARVLAHAGRAGADRRRVGARDAAWSARSCIPALAGLVVVAPDFVPVVLGEQWAAAVPVDPDPRLGRRPPGAPERQRRHPDGARPHVDDVPLLDRLHRRAHHRVRDRPALGHHRRRRRLRDLEHAGGADPDRASRRGCIGVSPWVFVRSVAGVAQAAAVHGGRRAGWRGMALVDAGVPRGARLVLCIVVGAIVFVPLCAWRVPEVRARGARALARFFRQARADPDSRRIMTKTAHPSVSVVVATHNRAERLAATARGPAGADPRPRPLRGHHRRRRLQRRHARPCSRRRSTAARCGSAASGRSRAAARHAARNRGWRMAEAPLIAFTDDDCVPTPGWLEALLADGRQPPRRDRPGADAARTRARSTRSTRTRRPMYLPGPTPHFETCNIVYPRALLEQVGGFDETYPAPGRRGLRPRLARQGRRRRRAVRARRRRPPRRPPAHARARRSRTR